MRRVLPNYAVCYSDWIRAMPFNVSRTTVHQPAAGVRPGDHVGREDPAHRVTDVRREGDRVRLMFEDGSTHEFDASETVPVVRAD